MSGPDRLARPAFAIGELVLPVADEARAMQVADSMQQELTRLHAADGAAGVRWRDRIDNVGWDLPAEGAHGPLDPRDLGIAIAGELRRRATSGDGT